MVNDALFRVEFDVLEEQELQNRCVLRLCICKHVADSPRVRKRMRPVTPCVPVRRNGHPLAASLAHYKTIIITPNPNSKLTGLGV